MEIEFLYFSRKGYENLEMTESQLEEMKRRNPIMPPKFKNPDPEDMYTDGSDNEYDFSHIKKRRENFNFIQKKVIRILIAKLRKPVNPKKIKRSSQNQKLKK